MWAQFVPQAHSAILTTFGAANPTIIPSGLKLYVPFIQKVYVISNMIEDNLIPTNIKTKNGITTKVDINV